VLDGRGAAGLRACTSGSGNRRAAAVFVARCSSCAQNRPTFLAWRHPQQPCGRAIGNDEAVLVDAYTPFDDAASTAFSSASRRRIVLCDVDEVTAMGGWVGGGRVVWVGVLFVFLGVVWRFGGGVWLVLFGLDLGCRLVGGGVAWGVVGC